MSNFWQAPLSVVRSPSRPSWALVVTHYQQLRKETLLANLCHQADRYPLSFERSRVAFNLQIVRFVDEQNKKHELNPISDLPPPHANAYTCKKSMGGNSDNFCVFPNVC